MDSDDEKTSDLYASFYTQFPDMVYMFEQIKPWTNFYDAIEQVDINMFALANVITKECCWPPWHPSKGPRSIEITMRFLSIVEETIGICMIDSYLSWIMLGSIM